MFQSTRPHGARRNVGGALTPDAIVSIHAPTRGATVQSGLFVPIMRCFNPRAHTGRDGKGVPLDTEGVVSIHAPTRGATLLFNILTIPTNVSIHAPTRGATFCHGFGYGLLQCFNPRAHTGRDLRLTRQGATRSMFQSTRPHGARLFSSSNHNWDVLFQSTRPHGARLSSRSRR